jgi:hypothetical protein
MFHPGQVGTVLAHGRPTVRGVVACRGRRVVDVV